MIVFSFSFADWILANNNDKNNSEIIFTSENQKVIIYENGVEIKWKYYTKEEFEKLLKTAKKVNIQPRAIPLVIPFLAWWSYAIPWIWTIIVTATGEILMTWAAIFTWTWLWDLIYEYFVASKPIKVEKVKEEEYSNAKRECRPTNNNKNTDTESNGFNKPKGKDPYSSISFYKDWKLYKIRYFDKNWNAELDIHYDHTDDGTHEFPHCHDWIKKSNWDLKPWDWYPCCK